MDEPNTSPTGEPDAQFDPAGELPPGNHPLEIAARRGIGPLSPSGRDVWHGHSKPCVSCGQLVWRDAEECDQCGQDLSREMIEKMRAHAGPWYVLEHVRPFPGVSLERIIRQIRRGLITETSIVRGPSTDFQWRFAMETPGLCRYFGRCWSCHEQVSPSDTYCQGCLSYLSFEKPRAAPDAASTPKAGNPPAATRSGDAGKRAGQAPPAKSALPGRPGEEAAGVIVATRPPADELKQLSAAVDKAEIPASDAVWDEPPRIGGIRATWIAAALLIVVIVALMILTQSRTQPTTPPPTAAPGMILLS